MIYLTVAFSLLVVYTYFATYIDKLFGIYSLGWTFTMGIVACLVWPLFLGLSILIVPLILIMRLGAKHRGDKFE
jgi:hypothetical protein